MQRPVISAERDRELEIVAMQVMLLLPNHDLGECLVVRDKCRAILQRWIEQERQENQEAIKRAVNDAGAIGTNVIRLPDAES